MGESRGEVQRAINVIEFFAGEARRITGETMPSELPNNFCYTIKQPIGPSRSSPRGTSRWRSRCGRWRRRWCRGNTVVFKPATLTPLDRQADGRDVRGAGLPRGVLNLVYRAAARRWATPWSRIPRSGDDVHRIERRRHRAVRRRRGARKKVPVRDGRQEPDRGARGRRPGSGRRGHGPRRVRIHRPALHRDQPRHRGGQSGQRVHGAAGPRTAALVVGHGLDPETNIGPWVDGGQLQTVLDYIEIGKPKGPRCRAAAIGVEQGADSGYFVAPTVFDRVTPSMRIAQEEVFGPVLRSCGCPRLRAAVAVANGVRFGLSSSIYTSDVAEDVPLRRAARHGHRPRQLPDRRR